MPRSLRQVGQRDVHGADVEDDHELGERKQQQQGHAGGLAVRSRRVAMALECCAGEACACGRSWIQVRQWCLSYEIRRLVSEVKRWASAVSLVCTRAQQLE